MCIQVCVYVCTDVYMYVSVVKNDACMYILSVNRLMIIKSQKVRNRVKVRFKIICIKFSVMSEPTSESKNTFC